MSATLSANISSTDRRFTASETISGLTQGNLLRIGDELLEFVAYQVPRRPSLLDEAKLVTNRGVLGTTKAGHLSGAAILGVQIAVVTSEDDSSPDPFAGGGGGVTVTVPPADPVAVTNITLPGGSVIDGTATPGVIVSDTEPEPGAGQFWLRQINDGNSYQLYVRNADDDAWMLASAGIGSGDYGDGFADAGDRQVGYFNLESGSVNGLEVQSAPDAEAVYLRAIKADGSASKQIRVEPTRITIPGSNVLTFGLPTSDPLVAGQLFTDGAPSANTPKALMVSGGS